MATMFPNLFDPKPQIPNPGPETQQKLFEQWTQYLQNPDVQIGLRQFGMQMLQPLDLGQNFLGAVGEGVGAASEAVDRARGARNEQAIAASTERLKQEDLTMRREESAADRALREVLGLGELDLGARRAATDEGQLDVNWFDALTQRHEEERLGQQASRAGTTLDPDTVARMAPTYQDSFDTQLAEYKDSLDPTTGLPPTWAPPAPPGTTDAEGKILPEAQINAARRAYIQNNISDAVSVTRQLVPDIVAGPAATESAVPVPPAIPNLSFEEYQSKYPEQLRPIAQAIKDGRIAQAISILETIQGRVNDPKSVAQVLRELRAKQSGG
jgi:hypothetical protein